MNKDQQNLERRRAQSQDNISSPTPENSQPPVIEVDVKVSIQGQSCAAGSEKTSLKRKSPRRRQHISSPPHSALVGCPSEASIISAAALEELSHLRSYYNKQLRQINYISHEHLQDSGSGMLTCIREPLRSLRLPSSTTIARSARNLWTRVSMRRKLIQR